MTVNRLSRDHDAFERELLGSAMLDEPSAETFVRVATAVGVAVGASLTGAVASAATVGAGTAVGATGAVSGASALGAGSSAAAGLGAAVPSAAAGASIAAGGSAAAVTSASVFKWVIFGAVGGLAASGGAHYATSHTDPTPAVQQAAAPTSQKPNAKNGYRAGNVRMGQTIRNEATETQDSVATPDILLPPPPPPSEDSEAVIEITDLDAVAAIRPKSAHAGVRATKDKKQDQNPETLASSPVAVFQAMDEAKATEARPAPDSSLSEQVECVDRARQALSRGNASESLALLKQYQEKWPSGVLATEASVLHIEALEKVGQHAMARKLAKKFIAAQPKSRHAERLRTLFSIE